ncbi:MAG: tetratricopeptide repeat protein [Oscillatoria princeps RMCB-10]|jgi:tetratricopeptide (TPR) repeat protein|nr:tetratricopeptide repeat protein [Oscillatoria princeps RMCB-10]
MLSFKTLLLSLITLAASTLSAVLLLARYRGFLRLIPGVEDYKRGAGKAKQGDCRGAVEAFTKALAVNPTLVEAYIERGVARSQLGDHQGAIEDFTRAISINPNDIGAYLHRANLRTAKGDRLGALEDYQKASKLFFEQNTTHKSRHRLRHWQQQPPLPVRPLTPGEEFFSQGLSKARKEDHKGAIEDFNQALRLNPQNSQIYYNRGRSRFKLGDTQGAIADLTHALQSNPGNAEAYFILGNIYRKLGAYQRAILNYTQALQLWPNNPKVYYNRAIASAELADERKSAEDKQNSLEDYQKAAALFLQQEDLLNYRRAINHLPQSLQEEISPKESRNTDGFSSISAASAAKTNSVSQDKPQKSQPLLQLERKLLSLLSGDRGAATILLSKAQKKNPGRPADWYLEKAIWDLERERGR